MLDFKPSQRLMIHYGKGTELVSRMLTCLTSMPMKLQEGRIYSTNTTNFEIVDQMLREGMNRDTVGIAMQMIGGKIK